MIFQRLHHPEVLRNNPRVKYIHKNHKLADAQTAGIFPATQPPRGLRSTTTPAESPAPPVLPALTFEHGKLVRKVSV